MHSDSIQGLVLFLAQPFQVGDEVSVKSENGTLQFGKGWHEGVCERVDLR